MNALYLALLKLWEGDEVPYEEVLGREGSEAEVRELISKLWVRCYPQGDSRLCVYSYKRPPKEPIPLLLDARGTVIAWTKDGPELVAYPFHKFFNLGEFEWLRKENLPRPKRVFEKLDGTMVSVFEYDGQLRAATRKRLDEDSLFAKKALELLEDFEPKGTHVFELLGPGSGSKWVDNLEDVFKEEDWLLVPLAYRDMKTLNLYPLKGPKEFSVNDLDELERMLDKTFEGFVVWFEEGKQRPLMVKVKSPSYQELVETLKMGIDGIAKLIIMNKLDDAAKFIKPELLKRAREVLQRLDEIEREVLKGRFDDEGVKAWLEIDPSRAVEEAVKVCLRRGC